MSNRLLKLLPVLLAFVLICSVSVFAVFADESVADESVAEESATEESTADESAAETSGDESEAETSGDKSEAETSATTSSTTSATTSTTSKDDHAGHDHDHEETSGGLSARTWQLIITAAVVVILVAVLFILAKTNTKFGQKIANFFKNYKSELGKIVWMPKNDLVKSTSIVLLVLVAACALIGLLDLAFSSVLNLLSSIG